MLALIPAPLHRAMLRAAHRVRIVWWRWRQPLVQGVSMIARDEAGRVLLIRQSYGAGDWRLPGGGLKRGEEPAAAALREFGEELRCGVTGLRALGVRDDALHGAVNRVHLFTARLAGEPRPDGREVVEARLFAFDALPPALSLLVRQRLAMLPS